MRGWYEKNNFRPKHATLKNSSNSTFAKSSQCQRIGFSLCVRACVRLCVCVFRWANKQKLPWNPPVPVISPSTTRWRPGGTSSCRASSRPTSQPRTGGREPPSPLTRTSTPPQWHHRLLLVIMSPFSSLSKVKILFIETEKKVLQNVNVWLIIMP